MGVRRLSVEAGGVAPEPGERLLRNGCVNVFESLLQTAGVHRRTWTPRCVTFRVEAAHAPILYLLERLVSGDRLHAGTHPVVHDAVDVVSPCRRCPVPLIRFVSCLHPVQWSIGTWDRDKETMGTRTTDWDEGRVCEGRRRKGTRGYGDGGLCSWIPPFPVEAST